MTTPSLWQALDTAILAAFTTQMGAASSYTTNKLAQLEIGDVWAPDTWTFPALLLVSNDAGLSSGPHGANATYHYMAVMVLSAATHALAKQGAQELFRRGIDVIRTWPAILAAANAAITTGTEHPQRLLWGDSRIEIRGRQGANKGLYLGIAVISFRVETTI
jgi:hypothetical protein